MPAAPDVVIDLGSGGGVPGLRLAQHWPTSRVVLVEAQRRRARFLAAAAAALGLAGVEVCHVRAEALARQLRAWASVVVARSFGPPAVTAECAAPLLVVGGLLVVSEPPVPGDRWPGAELEQLGLAWRRTVRVGEAAVAVLEQCRPAPDRFPRRVGIPAKRPLF